MHENILKLEVEMMISNKEMDDIMKIVKSLEESGLLIKSVSEKIENKSKEQKVRFFGMLLDTLSTSLLGNLIIGKEVKAKIYGKE